MFADSAMTMLPSRDARGEVPLVSTTAILQVQTILSLLEMMTLAGLELILTTSPNAEEIVTRIPIGKHFEFFCSSILKHLLNFRLSFAVLPDWFVFNATLSPVLFLDAVVMPSISATETMISAFKHHQIL